MKKTQLLLLVAVVACQAGFSQPAKKPVDFTLYDSWKSLSGQRISDDGSWLVYSINPTSGDGALYIQSGVEASPKRSFQRGTQALFDANSAFVAFKVIPQADSVRKAKLDKVKAEKMPKDTLGVYLLATGQTTFYPLVKTFKVADESSSWLAFQLEDPKSDARPEKKDSTATGKKPNEKLQKKPEYNGTPLYVVNPVTRDSQQFPLVTEYNFSKEGSWLYMISIKEDSVKTSIITVFDTKSGQSREIGRLYGVAKGLVSDESGSQLAFLFSADTSKTKVYSLFYWSEKENVPRCIADGSTPGMTSGWSVSENGRISFTPKGQRIFFGTAKKPEVKKDEKDTLLADDKVSVDIWHWREDVLQSIQLKQADQEARKNYQAVYNIKKGQMIQLGGPDFIDNYRLIQQGDYDQAFGFNSKPYLYRNSLTSQSLKDVYLIDLSTGASQKIFERIDVSPQPSPLGNYLVWWEPADSSWYAYRVKSGLTVNLTRELPVQFVNHTHDTPSEPGSYGMMGWSDKDDFLYLYDQFDIWKVDPDKKEKAVCTTQGFGRANKITFRYASLDPDEKFIDGKKENLFSVTEFETKRSGYYRFSTDKPDLKKIVLDDCRYAGLSKAKNADKLIWTRSTVSEYPDFWIGDLNFKGARKVSNANPLQSEYNWANVELVKWTGLNGEAHQGLLYKPENMDPSKKYPMIVYFYERHSDGLHTHYSPRTSASTVNPLEFASNGYLIFMPDIHFIIGNPGKSFYNAIMSGIMYLEQRGYVDMEHLGIQGQSWGGYGTAFMITQTDIFAAASPGAPVSNMTSAYGGIRNESGMVRQFQYEKTQSRIGGTLWEKPEYFIENSPLFFADRINTPCLIRHDDADGAVPFAEGVQLFVALRRLGKPAWLINYNNAPHNLSRQADKKDWSVRMMQFFNHYLKGEPAPDWLTHGVKAVDKKSNEIYYWPFTEK